MTDYSPVAPLFHSDAYKLDHRRQYALSGNVTRVYSNYTNRKSRMSGVDHVVHFGLQAYLQRYLVDEWKPFFRADRNDVEDAYYDRVLQVLGEDAADAIGTDHVVALHDLGYLPLRFCALPEGTRVPIRVPSFTVENTHPDFAWLTNFVETGLSAGYWQASTSATIAHEYRRLLLAAAETTGADLADVDYQLHDFSYRGMSSHETAAASGAAHLLSFKGTDSLVALDWIERYYGGPYEAVSVPATEHSVMSCGIASLAEGPMDDHTVEYKGSAERRLFERLLDLYPTGTFSVVSDTFDLWRVLYEILPALKDKVYARDGKVVVRPDSGDPVKILCGDPRAHPGSCENLGVVQILADKFGTRLNSAGYHTLDPHVGVIYGDSITFDRAKEIVNKLERMGFASTSVTLGVGSYTYQMNTRDTFGSAMKATWAEVDGKGVDLFKDPITDDGTKRSATGRLAVFTERGLTLIERATPIHETVSALQPIWEDGQFLLRQTFDGVRRVLNG